MFGKGKTQRRTTTKIVGATAAFTLIGGVAFAYWTGNGSGSGSATTKASVSAVVVSQTAATNLAPGESVALGGQVTNPNNTDVKVGTLTATITGVSGGAAVSDFSIAGNGVGVNTVVKKGTPLAWTGMTLNYANSDINQDAGKSATVSISYTLSAFTEPPAGPSAGTLTYTNKVLAIQHVGLWPHAGGMLTVMAGDKLVVPSCDWSGCHGDTAVTTAGVDNEFNFTSAGGFYVLDPKNIELVRGTTRYAHSPVILIG